mmetsp:Transcript_6865/g.17811  ORF Transcript_6865/g.17811 Transcript_6865/m.17811 type:complete len:274 (-) Transcript_6865:88-909(-)
MSSRVPSPSTAFFGSCMKAFSASSLWYTQLTSGEFPLRSPTYANVLRFRLQFAASSFDTSPSLSSTAKLDRRSTHPGLISGCATYTLNGLNETNSLWSNTMELYPFAMHTSLFGVLRSIISVLARLSGSKFAVVVNTTPVPMPTAKAPAMSAFVTPLDPPPPPPSLPPRPLRGGGGGGGAPNSLGGAYAGVGWRVAASHETSLCVAAPAELEPHEDSCGVESFPFPFPFPPPPGRGGGGPGGRETHSTRQTRTAPLPLEPPPPPRITLKPPQA